MNYKTLVDFEILKNETISSTFEKSLIADDVFNLLKEAYRDVKGGLHFSSVDDLLSKTSVWKIIYFQSSIVGVIIYKSKRGLKMVALGLSVTIDKFVSKHTKTMLSYIFKITFKNSWMEVSEGAERFIIKNGGGKYILPNTLAKNLTGKEILEFCEDGYHYKREINGVIKTKLIIGNPKI